MAHRETQRQITMLGYGTKTWEPAVVHTIDTYWPFHGVPYWEKEWRRLKKKQLGGKAHVVAAATFVVDVTTGHGHLIATPTLTMTAVSSIPTPLEPMLPPGATDRMTYNFALFSTTLPPHLDHVLTANNAHALVTGAGSVLSTLALPLDKVLLTWEIFGHGIKKRGLYYLDDVETSRVLRAGNVETSQHRRI
ncbi:unnamed protein product [Prunus armeniaca]